MEQLLTKCAWRAYQKYVLGSDNEYVISVDDLKHAGAIGYIKAEAAFDKSIGYHKETFLEKRVYWAIVDWIRGQQVISLPQQQYAKVKKLRKAKEELLRQGKTVEIDALVVYLGWSADEIYAVEAMIPRVQSVEQRTNEGEEDFSLLDRLPGNTLEPAKIAEKKEIAKVVQGCLEKLQDEKNRLILIAYMDGSLKLEDLAKQFAISAQAVHQRRVKALRQMKSCIEMNGIHLDDEVI